MSDDTICKENNYLISPFSLSQRKCAKISSQAGFEGKRQTKDSIAMKVGNFIKSTRRRHSYDGVLKSYGGNFMFTLMRIIRLFAIRLHGPVGAAAISVSAFYLSAIITRASGSWIYQALLAIILVRIGFHLARPHLGEMPVNDRSRLIKKLFLDELKIATAFVAICFFMDGPASNLLIATYLGLNIISILAINSFSKLVVSTVTPMATNGTSPCSRRAIVVGTGQLAQRAADMLIESTEIDTCLIGFLDYHRQDLWRYRDIPLVGHPDMLEKIVSSGQVDALILAVEQEDFAQSQELFSTAEEMGVTVIVMPSIYRTSISQARLVDFGGFPALAYLSIPESRAAMFAKSLVDRIGALTGLIIVSPILLVVAALVKLDSKGPILFRQSRAGLNGKPFNLYKFRTMGNDAEEKLHNLKNKNEVSGPVFKIKNDPRITRAGKYLRKYSIDELPQLINVLKGEMSLVGPRPALPKEVKEYEPWQRRKLSVRPGVTCIWQVSGRNNVEFEEWMRLDLQYIDNWSLWLDAKLLAKTIPAVLKGTGV